MTIPNAVGLDATKLYGLQPDPKVYRDTQFNVIRESMEWCLGNGSDTHKSWLKDLLQTPVPVDFTETEKTFLKRSDILNFYNDRFAVIYLGQAFSQITGEGAPKKQLTDNQKTALSFYLKAGITLLPTFSAQATYFSGKVYRMSMPELSLYINDQTQHTTSMGSEVTIDKDHDWGSQLLRKMYQEKANLISEIHAGSFTANQQLSINCAKMSLLGHEREVKIFLKTAFHTDTLVAALDHAKNSEVLWRAGFDAFTTAMEHLTDEDLIKIHNGGVDKDGNKNGVAIKNKLRKVHKELQDDLAVFHSTEQLAYAVVQFVPAIADEPLFNRLEKIPPKIITIRGVEFDLGKAPLKIVKSLRFLGIIGGLFNASSELKQWKNITEQEKVENICNLVSGVSIAIPEMIVPTGQMIWSKIAAKLRTPKLEAYIEIEVSPVAGSRGNSGIFRTVMEGEERVARWEQFKEGNLESLRDRVAMDEEYPLSEPEFNESLEKIDLEMEDTFRLSVSDLGEDLVEGAALEKVTSKWEALGFTGKIGTLFKGVGALAAIALAIYSTYNFIRDIRDFDKHKDWSQITMDGITMAFNIGFAICAMAEVGLAVGWLAETALIATIVPVAGPIMLLGILILATIEFATTKSEKKREDPMDIFMEKTFLPAFDLNTGWILSSPKGWVDTQPIPTENPYQQFYINKQILKDK